MTELRAGRLELADAYAAEQRGLVWTYAQPGAESPTSFFPSASRGALWRHGARTRVRRRDRRAALHETTLAGPLGIEVWSRCGAATPPRPSSCSRRQRGSGTPPTTPTRTLAWWRMEHAEALLELGRVDDALGRLDPWEATARRLGRRWAIAHATRCRGLVAAARGEVGKRSPSSRPL